ncbi:phosphate ABC transporter permease [Natronococcus wangiae]|uniref:phosphate ABC transporter permease n=1 Tax=Natronococcus wangiae TaxID=3068275 RepID=UPI00273E49D1|nr:phosphate ABC transporter permease [Natronococcus sp. AD5]
MIDGVSIGLVLGGVVLLFSGAAFSVYGVVLLGVLLGGSGGYLVGPSLGGVLGLEGAAAAGAPILLGALAGGLLGYLLLSAAVALTSFVVGTLFTMSAVAPAVLEHQWYLEWGVAIVAGLAAAFLGMLLTKWTMVGVTALVGAALASRSLTLEGFAAARQSLSLDPLLFDAASPLFLALVALGILSQFGLFKFGYVTRIARVLPGATVLPGRRREEPEPEPAG